MLQAFEALLTLELTIQHGVKEGSTDFDKSLQLYRTVAGVSLLVCSAFYIIGGVRKGNILSLQKLLCQCISA